MPLHDNKRARLLPNATLEALDNDLLIRCASYLDVEGLVQLGRTSSRFGIPQAGERRSLVNEAAHRRFVQGATDEERRRLPKYEDESDIGLYRALEQLRKPLCFDELVGGGFDPQEHPASVTCTGRSRWSTAMSGHVMRGGRHFAEFAITSDKSIRHIVQLGVIRPVSLTNNIDLEDDWKWRVNPACVSSKNKPVVAEKLRSQRTATWGDSTVHCCTYSSSHGHRDCTDWHNDRGFSYWQGSEPLQGNGRVGLLLDLDEGTLSVFKFGSNLGVMKEGLGGEYRWFVAVSSPCTISISRVLGPGGYSWLVD